MKFALLLSLFALSCSQIILAEGSDVAGNGQSVDRGGQDDVAGNGQGIPKPHGDVGGNSQDDGRDGGGDVGGNSQDVNGRRWALAMLRMEDSNLVNGRFGVNGRLAEVAAAVQELYLRTRPRQQDVAESISADATPSQLVEATAKTLLERLGIYDSRLNTEIGVLMGADR